MTVSTRFGGVLLKNAKMGLVDKGMRLVSHVTLRGYVRSNAGFVYAGEDRLI
jgi:hypothetical protein